MHPQKMFDSQEKHWQALFTLLYALNGRRPSSQRVYDKWVTLILPRMKDEQ